MDELTPKSTSVEPVTNPVSNLENVLVHEGGYFHATQGSTTVGLFVLPLEKRLKPGR
jgi:hypothetical protein